MKKVIFLLVVTLMVLLSKRVVIADETDDEIQSLTDSTCSAKVISGSIFTFSLGERYLQIGEGTQSLNLKFRIPINKETRVFGHFISSATGGSYREFLKTKPVLLEHGAHLPLNSGGGIVFIDYKKNKLNRCDIDKVTLMMVIDL